MKLVYHVTSESNLSSILAVGLTPKIGPRSRLAGEAIAGIYCFAQRESCVDALLGWLGESYGDSTEDLIILALDADGLTQDQAVQWEICVRERVPPLRIKHAYREREFF